MYNKYFIIHGHVLSAVLCHHVPSRVVLDKATTHVGNYLHGYDMVGLWK